MRPPSEMREEGVVPFLKLTGNCLTEGTVQCSDASNGKPNQRVARQNARRTARHEHTDSCILFILQSCGTSASFAPPTHAPMEVPWTTGLPGLRTAGLDIRLTDAD